MIRPLASALAVALALSGGMPTRAEASSPTRETENGRLFQDGMDHYASGEVAAALADFREVARREPDNQTAAAAVRRLEAEAVITPSRRTETGRDPKGPITRALERLLSWLKNL
jgi:hypothetical protein